MSLQYTLTDFTEPIKKSAISEVWLKCSAIKKL